MANKLIIHRGERFGKLEVICEVDQIKLPSGQFNRAFKCKCDCGNETIVRLLHLSRNRTDSCGCLSSTRNNECNTPIYRTYASMVKRTSIKHFQRHLYYDKGIFICEEWKNSFELFKEWAINNGFKEGLQIDRKDNSKGYYPENCRFVTSKVNCNNKDCTFFVTYHGETVPFMLLLEKLGIDPTTRTIRSRIERGWTHDRAIDTPIKQGNYYRGKRLKKNITNL